MKKEEERFVASDVFEGIVSVRTVIESMQRHKSGTGGNDRRILTCFYDENKRGTKEYIWLSHRAEELGFELRLSKREEIDGFCIGNTHGGIAAKCTERTIPKLSGEAVKENGFYVMLEGIEDPYNFGYALRSLYSAGADGVILTERNWYSAAGVVSRSSAGASEMLDVYRADAADAARIMKEAGYKIVCADLRNSVPIYEADLTFPIFLAVGGEKRGISRTLIDLADERVRIEYGRKFDASLSAASAATVVGYEIYRQNRGK